MFADMAELADALDLGSSVNRRAGSTPVIRIFFKADALLCVSAFFDFIGNCISYKVKTLRGDATHVEMKMHLRAHMGAQRVTK